jgi:predicted dehydrogenase
MTCKKINSAILGAGAPNIATCHQLPASLKSENVKVSSLCDVNLMVKEYAESCGAKAYTDYAEMLIDSALDMVQIATPDWLHCEQAEMALAAGKHVLLQKPACLNREELKLIQKALDKSSAQLKILLNCRETRLCRTIEKCIQDGVIGELREIKISYRGRRFPINNPESFYLKEESGGVWLHNGLHWLDEAFFYSKSLPKAVQVFANRNDNGVPQVLGGGSNYWSAFFPMHNGVTFNFEYNTMLLQEGLPGGMKRVLIGTGGEIRQDYGSGDIILFTPGNEPEKIELLDAGLSPEEDVIESFRRAIDSFAKQIMNEVEQEPKVSDSLALMNALFAGIESSKTLKCISLETE